MNQRERILAISVLAAVILAVGGFLFKWLFLDSLGRIRADIETVKGEINKKDSDLRKEQDEENALLRDDPRLMQWKERSLPEDKNVEAEIKSGHSAEEARKKHEDNVQVDYSHFLHDLVEKSGFTSNSIKISSAPADRKGGPILSGKTPAYTRMTFTVQAQGKLDAVQRMLEDFYKTPLLHQIRNLTLTARPAAPTRTVPGGVARAPGAAPGGLPGAAPGGAPAFPGAAPGGAPALPGGFGALPGAGGFRANAAPSGDLDLSLTVEALLVAGAQKRDELLPKNSDLAPKSTEQPDIHTLAYSSDTGKDSERRYSDMLIKNMFTGVAAKSQLKEDHDQVLSSVRLTSIWNDDGRRWQATIWDQGKGTDEMKLKRLVLEDFTVKDSYGNDVLKGKMVKIDANGVIFQADGKYYRWRCGEYLGKRLAKAGATPSTDDTPQYIPGVLDNPLKSDEIKDLGLADAAVGKGN